MRVVTTLLNSINTKKLICFGMAVNQYPTVCNLCGGEVEYIPNSEIYNGVSYGSGYCYRCKACGAYVGTYTNKPRKALGILANGEMREWKMKCHNLFDSFWKDAPLHSKKRSLLYTELATELSISVEECHFGFFDMDMLKKAYTIIQKWKTEQDSTNNGNNNT